MKKSWTIGLIGAGAMALSMAAFMAPPQISGGGMVTQDTKRAELGEAAPDFTLTALDGKEYKLSDFKGKTVILEWFNPECPYVVWHYTHEDGQLKGAYQEMKEADKDLVWLVINSGAPGKQGTGIEKNKMYQEKWEIAAPILIDETGKVGKMYDAKTSPHMYVIDKEGVLRYHGAIDNAPNGRVRGGGEKINFVENAYKLIMAGETVSPDYEKPYGCGVKY